MDEWPRDRVADLADLVGSALPHEHLSADELLACCWDDPGVVLALPGGAGAVAAVVRGVGDLRIGQLKLVAVDPGRRRLGHGRSLLAAAEAWAAAQGAAEMQIAGAAPFYLWPGVDVHSLAMLCLAEVAGYEVTGCALNLSLPTTFRAEPAAGVVTRRVLHESDVAAVEALVATHWPWWLDETRRGVEHGTCHAAFADPDRPRADGEAPAGPEALGFACHSVNRAGWIGPMGTDPAQHHRGLGHALLGQLCRDLTIADFADAEVAWIGPVAFYAKAGAAVSHMYRTYRKRLG